MVVGRRTGWKRKESGLDLARVPALADHCLSGLHLAPLALGTGVRCRYPLSSTRAAGLGAVLWVC